MLIFRMVTGLFNKFYLICCVFQIKKAIQLKMWLFSSLYHITNLSMILKHLEPSMFQEFASLN